MLCGCSQRDRDAGNANTFTLATGVKLIDDPAQCPAGAPGEALAIQRTTRGYRVNVSSYFACQDELAEPYLTVPHAGKMTLVLGPKPSEFGFHTSCECARSLSVELEGRLAPGKTLYVVNDQEVVGHLVVP